MKIAVSACLIGVNSKYNGTNNYREALNKLLEGHELLVVCPETVGELDVPREPAEIVGDKVIDRSGKDVSEYFRNGVLRTVKEIEAFNPDLIVLKSNSPSCGKGVVYDGTFSGQLVVADGLLARELNGRYPILSVN